MCEELELFDLFSHKYSLFLKCHQIWCEWGSFIWYLICS